MRGSNKGYTGVEYDYRGGRLTSLVLSIQQDLPTLIVQNIRKGLRGTVSQCADTKKTWERCRQYIEGQKVQYCCKSSAER